MMELDLAGDFTHQLYDDNPLVNSIWIKSPAMVQQMVELDLSTCCNQWMPRPGEWSPGHAAQELLRIAHQNQALHVTTHDLRHKWHLIVTKASNGWSVKRATSPKHPLCSDWYGLMWGTPLQAFCEHYETMVLFIGLKTILSTRNASQGKQSGNMAIYFKQTS